MKAGDNSIEIKLISMDCLDFFVNPDYKNNQKVGQDEIYHILAYDLVKQKINDSTDKLTISIEIKMFLKTNKLKLVSFTAKNIYYVSKCSNYQLKYDVLGMLLNQTIGNTQGMWIVKIENNSIRQLIPEAYNKFLEDELEFKKTLSEWK